VSRVPAFSALVGVFAGQDQLDGVGGGSGVVSDQSCPICDVYAQRAEHLSASEPVPMKPSSVVVAGDDCTQSDNATSSQHQRSSLDQGLSPIRVAALHWV